MLLLSEMPYQLYFGPFVAQATFQDGQLHGAWTILDAQRNKISEIGFHNGERHGQATRWYPNGPEMQRISFQHGVVHGVAQFWDRSGKWWVRNDLNRDGACSSIKCVMTRDTSRRNQRAAVLPPRYSRPMTGGR